MLFITTQSLPSFLTFKPNHYLPRLKPRQVPLWQWAIQVLVLTAGSLLNNWAFAYQVPLTVLIVFRSAGSSDPQIYSKIFSTDTLPGLSISMLFGFVFLKKRYSLTQIVRPLFPYIQTLSNSSFLILVIGGSHFRWCRSRNVVQTKAYLDFLTIDRSICRSSPEVCNRCNDARRFSFLDWTTGLAARKDLPKVWTMLERSRVLYSSWCI